MAMNIEMMLTQHGDRPTKNNQFREQIGQGKSTVAKYWTSLMGSVTTL